MDLKKTPPEALLQSIRSNNCVLFMGAGMGHYLNNSKGEKCPDSQKLTENICSKFGLESTVKELAIASELVELRNGKRGPLLDFLRNQLLGYEPDENYLWIPTIRWKAVYTTNFDDGILNAYHKSSKALQNLVPIFVTVNFVDYSVYTDVPVYYIHGCLNQPGYPIVITQTDYSKFREKRRMLFEQLKIHHAESTFLYIGYSNKDTNWQSIHSEMQSEFIDGNLPRSYRIDPVPDLAQSEILYSKGIETINCNLSNLIDSYNDYIFIHGKYDQYSEIPKNLPRILNDKFKISPAMCKRLLSNWDIVNSVDIETKPNISEFYKGTKANWSLIDGKYYFDRDIEENIFGSILDFATDPKSKCISEIILGPACYGITTLMMSIAWNSVKTELLNVFYFKDGASLLDGDIEFAIENFPGKLLFVIDQASKLHNSINDIVSKCKFNYKNCFFLLGCRLNEWRQERPRIKCKTEYLVQPLSEHEIDKLISVLDKNNSLGELKELDNDLRRKILINKHKQELLVILRETIENNSFDAIIENEFNNIQNADVRTLYGIVSGLHQYGILSRISLLSNLIKCNLSEVPSLINQFAEGIIEIVDDPLKDDIKCLITRHRIISKIVWHKCFVGSKREDILLDLMKNLNLAYKQDQIIFDEITKDDDVVDSIRSFESKTSFFESACKKDINNPYVRQHYARMLLREEKYNLALSQIETGLKIDKNARVLYHTKGHILGKMALDADDRAIGERYFSRAIDSYNICISMNKKDEYGYQSLAQTYLDWAIHWEDPDTYARNISRCEEVISEGWKNVTNRESLFLISSKLENLMGDHPKSIQLLEKALEENPSSSICRYLLARDSFKINDFDKVLSLLRSTIESRFDEIRSFVLFAKAKSFHDQSYNGAISILKQADPVAWTDPIFVATLGGMYSLSGNIGEAEEIFEGAKRQRFPEEEARKIGYQPSSLTHPSESISTSGTVIVAKSSYLLIQSKDFGKFFYPSPKIEGNYVTTQTILNFTLSFTAKGGLALNPSIAN